MTATVHLTPQQARRIAVRAQLLTAARPVDLLATVRRLGFLQLDPTKAVAPSADLVAWARLGSGYAPADLRAALADRTLVEHRAYVRPREDLALYLADMRAWREGADGLDPWQHDRRAWLEANSVAAGEVLARLEQEGPLSSRAFPDRCAVPWQSSGWSGGKNVTKLFDLLEATGQVAVSGRAGRERVWDLASRILGDLPEVEPAEADRRRRARRLASLGVARGTGTLTPGEPNLVGEVGVAATVEGTAGTWRVDPDLLGDSESGTETGTDGWAGRTALLSPFDRLVHDRERASALFGFEYTLEMYKPPAARRWGYYALPVLHDDRLVGKVDATADHRAGTLRVHAVHEDEPFPAAVARAVAAELEALAGWLGLAVERT